MKGKKYIKKSGEGKEGGQPGLRNEEGARVGTQMWYAH